MGEVSARQNRFTGRLTKFRRYLGLTAKLLLIVVTLPLLPVAFLWYVNIIGLYYLLIAMVGQQRVVDASTKRAVTTSWSMTIKIWDMAGAKNLIRIPVSWKD